MSRTALVVVLAGTLAVRASIGRADSIEDFGPKRQLAGHVFFPSLIITNPFLSTYFDVFTAAGYEWIDGPDFDTLGNLIGTTGNKHYRAQAMAMGATFQAGVTDYLAIRVRGAGGIDGGTNARSALVVGAIQSLGAGVGATFSWKLRSNLRFGVTGDFVYTHDKLLQPLNAIHDSISAGALRSGRAREDLNDYSFLPGVTIAYAASDVIGILAFAQYNFTEQTDGDSRHFQFVDVGASVQFDLLPALAVPLGFPISYRASIPFEDSVRLTNTVETGVFYTGRKDLDLGLDIQVKWFDLRPDHIFRLDSTELIGAIELRYHWN